MAKQNKITIEGAGDKLAKVIKAVTGIKPCDACEKRKELLNKLFPTKQAVEMTAGELISFAQVKDKKVLDNQDLTFIETLYFKTFSNIRKYKLCRACVPVWKTVIDQLTQVYNIQISNLDESYD